VTGLVYASCSDAESNKESSCDYDTHGSVGPVSTDTLHQTEPDNTEHNHNHNTWTRWWLLQDISQWLSDIEFSESLFNNNNIIMTHITL